ncbi:MAG: membrane dipeptidase, partial [Candidatus Latescibacterota bacterium]
LPRGFDSTVEDFVDAIDDMVQRIGIDHVAIGTDSTHDQPLEFWHYLTSQQGTKYPSTFADPTVPYTELSYQPKGMESPVEFPNLADALMNRGYSSEDILKLLGRNWMDLFERVWNPR